MSCGFEKDTVGILDWRKILASEMLNQMTTTVS